MPLFPHNLMHILTGGSNYRYALNIDDWFYWIQTKGYVGINTTNNNIYYSSFMERISYRHYTGSLIGVKPTQSLLDEFKGDIGFLLIHPDNIIDGSLANTIRLNLVKCKSTKAQETMFESVRSLFEQTLNYDPAVI